MGERTPSGRRAFGIFVLITVLGMGLQVRGAEAVRDYRDLLSTDKVGARDFIKKHRTWDGTGVVVAILDSGVDMNVAGLRELPGGGVKVIEARDFSGQGRVRLEDAKEKDEAGEKVLTGRGGVVRGHLGLVPKPSAESLMVGFLEEETFGNSEVRDINDNGSYKDVFALVMGEVREEGKEPQWYLWPDRDGDGHVDDEKPVRSYEVAQEFFLLTGNANEGGRAPMAFAATVNGERRELSLHYADGSHGTHVAGIAAGYRINGQEGYDGIAPGARVMSLKIGNNTLAGGATTSGSMMDALNFVAEWSDQHKTPVIVNMSYGVGSEVEGRSDIDESVDNLLRRHPFVAVATSAGNAGPGLSTMGTPAGAMHAFSTGAMLTRENASTLYGTRLDRDQLFFFSSRGGELCKPDGVAPGVSASTIPAWEWGNVMRGTSMASPQAAGCMALVASAAVQSNPPVEFTGALLARALRNSGAAVPGYTLLDQGSGLVNVGRAWESLRKLSSHKALARVAGFQVVGRCPFLEDEEGQTSFFRTGTWFPSGTERVDFRIQPIFMRGTTDQNMEEFFAAVKIVSDGDWVKPDKSKLVFRKGQAVDLSVTYDQDALREPGIHTMRLRGVYEDGGSGQDNTLFELWNTVVVPEVFDLTQGFTRLFKAQKSRPGEIRRFFLRVPEGAASMLVNLSPAGDYTYSMLHVFDPRGDEVDLFSYFADSRDATSARVRVDKEDLVPGVWEVVVNTHYMARETSEWDLLVAFNGFSYETPSELSFDLGEKPGGRLTLRSSLDQYFKGRASGKLDGLWKEESHVVNDDEFNTTLTLDGSVSQVTLELSMPAEDYGLFTDVAINILDDEGKAVTKGDFSMKQTSISFDNDLTGTTGSRNYRIQVLAAYAVKERKPWHLTIRESLDTSESAGIDMWCGGFSHFSLYPGMEKSCQFEVSTPPRLLPEGYVYKGYINLVDGSGKGVVLRIPLRLGAGGN